MVMTCTPSGTSGCAGPSSSPESRTRSRWRMNESSEWSVDASQNSAMFSANLLTSAVAGYRDCSISSKKRSRTSRRLATSASRSSSGRWAEAAGRARAIASLGSRTTRNHAPGAAPVPPKRHRAHVAEAGEKALEARARRPAKAIDRLVVVADHERAPPTGDQFHQPLLGEVQILVLVDEDVRVARGVASQQGRVLLEHPHREQQQVVEVEQPLPAALALIGAEELHAGAHQRCAFAVFAGRRPGLEAPQRNELLLQALEHLEHRRDQVVRPLVPGQGGIPDAPHQLPGQDPPLGARNDPKPRRHAHGAAVLAQPAAGQGVERAHRRRLGRDQLLDPVAHLVRGPLGEGHDEDRRGAGGGAPSAGYCPAYPQASIVPAVTVQTIAAAINSGGNGPASTDVTMTWPPDATSLRRAARRSPSSSERTSSSKSTGLSPVRLSMRAASASFRLTTAVRCWP